MSKYLKNKKIQIVFFYIFSILFFVFALSEFIYNQNLLKIRKYINTKISLQDNNSKVIAILNTKIKRSFVSPIINYDVTFLLSIPLSRNVPCSSEECREKFYYDYFLKIFSKDKDLQIQEKITPIFCNKPENLVFSNILEINKFECSDKTLISKYPTDKFFVNIKFTKNTPVEIKDLKIKVYSKYAPENSVFETNLNVVE